MLLEQNEVRLSCMPVNEDGSLNDKGLVRVSFIDFKKAETAFIRLQGALTLYQNYSTNTPQSEYLNAVIQDLLEK